jgi:hypothetical protein
METVSSSEILVDFYRTTQRYNPKDNILHNHHYENLKTKIAYTNSEYEMAFGWIVRVKLDSTFRHMMRVDVKKVRYVELEKAM